MFLPILTERLIMREFEEADWKPFLSFLGDEEVCRYMVFDPLDENLAINYVLKFLNFQKDEPRKFVKFAVLLKENNEIIGECGIIMPNYEHKEGELVFRYSRAYWGNGYATEAAKAVVEFGFNMLGLHRIDAFCDMRNEASVKVLEKIGMLMEGCIREHKWIKDEWRSSYIFSILANEYSTVQNGHR